MSNNYYTIIVCFKAKAGREQALKEFLQSIITIASQSRECICHDLHESVEERGTFMFYENWVDKEAHERHVACKEVQEWRSKLGNFLARPYEVSFWEKIS